MKTPTTWQDRLRDMRAAAVNDTWEALRQTVGGRVYLIFQPADGAAWGRTLATSVVPGGWESGWQLADPQAFHGGMSRQEIECRMEAIFRRLPIIGDDSAEASR